MERSKTFLAEETFDKCVDLLHDYPVSYALVTCPYKELKRRHELRGDRGVSKAFDFDYEDNQLIGDLDSLHDVLIDTSNESGKECLNKILSVFTQSDNAFKKLWRTRSINEEKVCL